MPQEIFDAFSRDKRKEVKDLNAVARRMRSKRKARTPLPGHPPSPRAQPRSNNTGKKRMPVLLLGKGF